MKDLKVLKTIAFSIIGLKKFPIYKYKRPFIEKHAFGSYSSKGIDIFFSNKSIIEIYFKNNELKFYL